MEYHSGGSLPLLGRPRYCPGANTNGGYLCETGHCCGETGCCTYYYELWWFWMLWTILILFSCCCAYRHRRAKLRVQQQQRQREISLLAYHGANSYPTSMLDLSFLASLKLPSYEEVAAQPSTPPPPYSSVFTTPRYPQPPCTVDPHLLTQHGPLLHRPLSDGPSSISSDNSSSCSCDSCCPSSPCSSTISAPVTYETDTSHASTPSEATPLTFDVTMENISATASCLEVNETCFASERTAATVTSDINEADAARAQEPVTKDSSVPNQTVTVAVVTRAASPQPSLSPGLEVAPPLGTTYPTKQQLDQTPCNTTVSTCSSSILHSPRVADTALPSIQKINTEVPAESLETTAVLKTTSLSSPPIPTDGAADRPEISLTVETLNLRTFNSTIVPGFPNLELSPDVGRPLALITDSAGPPVLDLFPSLVPIPTHLNLSHASTPVPPDLTQVSVPVRPDLTQASSPVPANHGGDAVPAIFTQSPEPVLPNYTPQTTPTLVLDSTVNPTLSRAHSNCNLSVATTPASSILAHCQNAEMLPGASLTLVPTSPVSDLPPNTSGLDLIAVPPESGPCLFLSQLSDSDIVGSLPSDLQDGCSSGSGLCSGAGSRSGSPSAPAPVLAFPTPASSSSCPAITIESEASFVTTQSPPPPFLPSPAASASTSISTSIPAPALLLDPLTTVHQSAKGGASSGHASSLSPSPRATQSPPKQTLFSPCVDVIEPGPPNWEDGEGEQEADMDDYEDDDMGADESQYRHRRLTGDSGIEVCRCRVKKEDDEEEEEEEEGEGKRGGGGQREKKGGGNADLHDSVDCPSRGQLTTREELTLCSSTSTTTPTSEDSGEVVIVMETV